MTQFKSLITVLAVALLAGLSPALAQVPSPIPSTTQVQAVPAFYATIPLSATAAANAQTTLTIPAPAPNQYNYVCTLQFSLSQNATGSAVTNAVTTSTNFNGYALKVSHAGTANGTYDSPVFIFGQPATGCAKSTSPGTATTFVSPAAVTNAAFSWYVTYYQAP